MQGCVEVRWTARGVSICVEHNLYVKQSGINFLIR